MPASAALLEEGIPSHFVNRLVPGNAAVGVVIPVFNRARSS